MDFKDLIVTSWQNMLDNIGPLLLITFVQLILIIITFGILAPVTTAGYVYSLMRVVREGRSPVIGDLFTQMRLFLPLFVFSILAVLAIFIGFFLLVLPGFAVIAIIAFAAFYLLPLMVDEELGLIDALKASWDLAVKAPISDQFIVVIIYVAIMSLGSSLPFAFLVTQPMATFIMVIAYGERRGKRHERHESDERFSQPAHEEPLSASDDKAEQRWREAGLDDAPPASGNDSDEKSSP